MRCSKHSLEGMVGTAAAVMHRDPWAATLWLRHAHAALPMLCLCRSAGGHKKSQMRRTRLPYVCSLWLPGRSPGALCHTQARRDGRQCLQLCGSCSWMMRCDKVKPAPSAARTAARPWWVLQENIKLRRCEEDGCHITASFGYPGGQRMRCATHRLEGMVGTAASCSLQHP